MKTTAGSRSKLCSSSRGAAAAKPQAVPNAKTIAALVSPVTGEVVALSRCLMKRSPAKRSVTAWR
jgi:PTS system N-acetylglucosamine-specific IIC component